MKKIMVVEDDNSLKEIYSIRLTAEGYEVVSAADGEEALAVAVREKPDLILSDVMMPKISGFDMLDILRQTPETKNIKVIMMTALSSDDQRARGESLGADKYLVKSQVGIEDVINAIHEVIGDKTIATPAEQAVETVAPTSAVDQPSPAPSITPPVSASAIPNTTPEPVAPVPTTESASIPSTPTPEPVPTTTPVAEPASPMPTSMPAPESNPVPVTEPATVPVAPAEPVAGQPTTPSPIPPVAPVAPENEAQNGIPQA